MKKLLTLFLAIALISCLASCGEAVSKPKEVENMELTLTFPDWIGLESKSIERTGAYTGTIVNGLPEGKGRFDTKNQEGTAWYYDGEFKNGLFHGYGQKVWTDAGQLSESGNYVDGVFTPTKSQLFNSISQDFNAPYALSDQSIAFLDKNENLFPCSSESDKSTAVSLTDFEVQYKQLTKNIDTHLSKMLRAQNLTAIQVFEQNMLGHIVTYVLAHDQDFNCYIILVDGHVEIYDNDVFELYGLPIDTSSFDNISGGITNVVVTLGSIINVA